MTVLQVMRCAKSTSTGGPVISLEVTSKPDAMAIVWRSISTQDEIFTGYKLYLNGQLCGDQVWEYIKVIYCKPI